ncbi:MAG: hypothetical protein L0Z62_03725 [Gemmataceae bacterium]|nr:hypothetical protein [Gemmataceae bacterium]
MSKRVWLTAAACVLLIACCGSFFNPFNPARRPPAEIRATLLKETPFGSSLVEVLKLARNRGWSPRVHESENKTRRVHAVYGWYRGFEGFPWATVVWITWDFDEQGNLNAVDVWTTLDAP